MLTHALSKQSNREKQLLSLISQCLGGADVSITDDYESGTLKLTIKQQVNGVNREYYILLNANEMKNNQRNYVRRIIAEYNDELFNVLWGEYSIYP